ncbi:MAG: hypothetical protein A3B96_03510 [Candidatus Spechtbacteria bacterium RIFCSPHIGHO2_02_FULL_43_15b]|uniref:Uncharacterized protein n=1 Tax=Candidatus Spechtbacteria bacterium RIFCSPHIGHO2_01_FULL_43_30 TaxID=1802158 RepID=A0A1G2H5V4_9BACT|nr:MAG: hypothetical protein A2827_00145 [Candidatus Spechtbacteria bacterium RIFCSPHIGHO2_01_FULL_43_30]OGZ59790.1 MAG: hypothetical protein A3B96_03510 [Candidatus Spechtbacteria bacterium RIFCSPHIGHO2_02_FULL_43_15b]
MAKVTHTEFATKEVVDDIICNACGNSCKYASSDDYGGIRLVALEFADLSVEWGYGSEKDGERHESALCESCYDKFVKSFKIPPVVHRSSEWLE